MAAKAILCLLLGVLIGASPAASAEPAPQADVRPAADHHIHLLSPMAAALATPPLQPRIDLPTPLARVAAAREKFANDQAELAKLYAADALYHRGGTAPWARGGSAAAGYVKWRISDTPYHVKPVALSMSGSSADVAGYFVEADGSDRHFASFLLSLAKGRDGVWRISAEMYQYFGAPEFQVPYTADQLVAKLDEAGIARGVVLSNAYYYDAVRPEPVPDEYDKVRAENDWVGQQVARYPRRLVAFCSFNLLRNYALAELNRCADSGRFTGLKLHFNAAQLNFRDPGQVAQARRVFEAANRRRLPLIVHVRPGNVYGREEAQAFLRELVAAAPDVPIQIAHLWGGESYAGEALAVYADAVARRDPVTRNLYFDLSGIPNWARAENMEEIASLIRRIGTKRVFFGSDAPLPEAWPAMRKALPLTEAEFRAIAGNVAPYLLAP
ncbi:MAG TPA: amidohydrolase family protein [Allosphingosinicella sp.]|jgi:predicted TIM-barrel fold metal-dependent hydrolase